MHRSWCQRILAAKILCPMREKVERREESDSCRAKIRKEPKWNSQPIQIHHCGIYFGTILHCSSLFFILFRIWVGDRREREREREGRGKFRMCRLEMSFWKDRKKHCYGRFFSLARIILSRIGRREGERKLKSIAEEIAKLNRTPKSKEYFRTKRYSSGGS